MFIRKWTPVRAPDTGVGSSDVEGDEDALPVTEIDDSLADERTESRKSIRDELESSFKKANEAADKVEKTEKTEKVGKGRDGRKGTALKSRASQELAEAAEDDADLDVEEPEAETTEGDAGQAPASLPKEARAEWAKTPKAVQAAWTKRDQDIDKGVKQLKASYAEIDQVLAPRTETLRQMGHTPAQAVGQLFSWFDALGLDPERVKNGQPPLALLALANSFGLDLSGAFQQQQKADPAKAGKEAAAASDDEISPAIRNHIAQLEQRLAGFEQNVGQGFQNFQQTFATQAQEQTHKILNAWSEGKPHFEDVRLTMAKIIQAGMVAPKEDGSADLDKAYDMALYSHPEVREKVLADRRKAAIEKKRVAAAAEQKAQQQAADKARRTGAGLGPSAPGITLANEQKKPGKKSVRESIADAMSELGS